MSSKRRKLRPSPCPDFGSPSRSSAVSRGSLKPKSGSPVEERKTLLIAVCDHTETLQLEYDPEKNNYSNLLNMFWENHDVTAQKSAQYKSAIFYHSEEQKRLAEESSKAYQSKIKKQIRTHILPAEVFYDAEDYHQKYMLRKHNDILQMLKLSPEELKESTAAAHLNGYLGQNGSKKQFEANIEALNLTQAVADAVQKILF